MGRHISFIEKKIIHREDFHSTRKQLEKQNKQLVFTNGCFDILHRGHVEYLRQAKVLGDLLFVGLNSDNSVTRLKGRGRPILAQEDRAFILASLAVVDYVSIFDEETPQELIQAIQPDILVKGGDYRLNQIVGRRVVEERGGQVKTIPLIPNRSTSDILQKIISFTKQGFFNKV